MKITNEATKKVTTLKVIHMCNTTDLKSLNSCNEFLISQIQHQICKQIYSTQNKPRYFLFKETIMKRFKERLLHCSPKLDSLKIELSDLTSNSVPIEVREKVDPMFCRLECACSTLVALSYTTAGGFFFSSSSSLVCSREEKSIPEVDISSKVPLPRHFPCADTFIYR